MLYDAQGLAVTTDSPAAIQSINHFIDQSLLYGNAAEPAILQALTADRSCAIAHAYAAAYFLSQETAIGWQQAQPHVKAARYHDSEATEREQWYIQAIVAWAKGDINQALTYHRQLAQQYPRDLISVQQGQYHYFYQGNATQLRQIAEIVFPMNQDRHYLYGMLAFGLEQCGELDRAEAIGRQAVAMNRHDPWAHHAVAHVLEQQGRVEAGITWMEGLADTWDGCNSMLYTHNWWHIALYYLVLEDWQTILQLYDHHIWGRADHTASKDLVGAIATLLRLELQGTEVGDRWQKLLPSLQLRLHEHALAFQDLHYIYALARIGCPTLVKEMLQSLTTHIATLPPTQQAIWLNVALPAARGMVAHANCDWSTTITELQTVLPQLSQLGGSHTQRQLFQQLYQDAIQQNEQSYKHSKLDRSKHLKFSPMSPMRTLSPKLAVQVS
ncbi:tetratricopeptide repeat protein [Pantanalinema rosaneae CENA516]|uniref:tetratricopeptide repeat protein n=1 Tax=Pantanalinema rosaneae TaxID=1620701 RepID=UPI003D701366